MTVKHLLITAAVATLSVASAASAFAASSAGDAGYRDWEHGPSLSNAPSALSRDQVRAELLQAQRGGLIVNGDTAVERVLYANFKSTLSRAQVRAEAIEARRLGLLDGNGEREPREATPAQAESIRQAGLRATGDLTLAAGRQR